jgi:hypothetical protein
VVLDLGEAERLEHGRHVVAEAAAQTFFSPYQPRTGLPADRAQASTVSGVAPTCTTSAGGSAPGSR